MAALFVIFLSACSRTKSHGSATDTTGAAKSTLNAKFDTLAYEIRQSSDEADNCKDTDNCASYAISYPIFKDQPALNGFVKTCVLNLIDKPAGSAKPLDSLIDDAADDFLVPDTDVNTISHAMASNFDGNITVTQIPGIIILTSGIDAYSAGAAHPNSRTDFFNWDIKNKKEIKLKDIMTGGYKKTLTKIAEVIFRKNEGLSATEPLTNYFFDKGVFALNDNFELTPDGINFYYNSYEIKSYAEGPSDLLIPYSKIKHLLRPNTVVSQYIK